MYNIVSVCIVPLLPKGLYHIFNVSYRHPVTASKEPKLSPPTPFADNSFVAEALPHLMMSRTLPRKSLPSMASPAGVLHPANPGGQTGSKGRKYVNTEVAIPPPPQYKGVHFAPQVIERRRSLDDSNVRGVPGSTPLEGDTNLKVPDSIPVEGLPTRPAIPKAETVAIQVRNNPVPLLSAVMKQGGVNSANISSFENKKQPPVPPPKTSSLTSNHLKVLGVRDKALAASAAGCEIVFVSPDEGFNEEVLAVSSSK